MAIFEGDGGRISAIQFATGSVTRITPAGAETSGISLSADGSTVLYLGTVNGTRQLFISSTISPLPRQLTNLAQGVSEAAISGDGRVAWAATVDNRLATVDAASGVFREILTPPILETVGASTMPAGVVVPGSLMRMTGHRLGNRIRFRNILGEVISAQPEEVVVQVPWDLPPPEKSAAGFVYETVSAGRDDSPLEAVTPEFTASYMSFQPAAFYPPIHEDWSDFVTQRNPAHAGEVLHIYATGLGATDCAIRTGESAPLNQLCRAARPTEWDFWWNSTDFVPAEVLFSGLAPGLVGLYQMDVRAPAVLPANRLKLIADQFGWNIVADFPVVFP
jgi:uncharacterized protein (TIGR03437 family)